MGYNLVKRPDRGDEGLITEGEYGYLFEKYSKEEFVKGYNDWVQKKILPKAGIGCNIHLLDCTKVTVNLSNENYGWWVKEVAHQTSL
ncbi:MAG: hypothetical protein LBF74_02815 [Treponema sp.]|nr:hypothetical protein [Treponema sp.]